MKCSAAAPSSTESESTASNRQRDPAPNPAGAAHGGDAASPLIVLQHVQDLPDVADRAGWTAVRNEGVILDSLFLLVLGAEAGGVRGEMRRVREYIVGLGKVDEGAHARA